ncbi:extracellular solute-binding protein, partial [Anaerolineae bacterium AMX1]|nr:extracellular solute-binding protein [Anaerolineae bacterium AMX1]
GQPTMSVYGSSYIVLRSDETRQLAAWLFVRWMLSPDRQARWVQTTGMFPLRSLTLNLVSDYATAHPLRAGDAALRVVAADPPRAGRRIQLHLPLQRPRGRDGRHPGGHGSDGAGFG